MASCFIHMKQHDALFYLKTASPWRVFGRIALVKQMFLQYVMLGDQAGNQVMLYGTRN